MGIKERFVRGPDGRIIFQAAKDSNEFAEAMMRQQGGVSHVAIQTLQALQGLRQELDKCIWALEDALDLPNLPLSDETIKEISKMLFGGKKDE